MGIVTRLRGGMVPSALNQAKTDPNWVYGDFNVGDPSPLD